MGGLRAGGIVVRWRTPRTALNVEDYRNRARRALPDMVWSYLDGGAEDQVTLRANREAFDRWRLMPRVLTGREGVDASV
jgi:isopentenyl diphosphate isomerase/L-lactate dehydrogenase-like FMN-dependent dehydrogenase